MAGRNVAMDRMLESDMSLIRFLIVASAVI
eukprot:SAG31_NODE_50144_length_120_cov_16.809524_1_plen_29_part_01